MFISGQSYTVLFIFVVACNFVALVAYDDLGQVPHVLEDAFATGVGKDETHLIVKRSSKPIVSVVKRSAERDEKCLLFNLDVVLLVHDPQNFTNIKHINISLTSAIYPDHRCPNQPLEEPRIFDIAPSRYPVYTLRFSAIKSKDGKKWYFDYIEVKYTTAYAFSHYSDYNHETIVRTSPKEYFMETPIDKSFSCKRWWKILLYNEQSNLEAELHFNAIQIQVFNIKADRYSPEFQCDPHVIKARNCSNSAFVAMSWLELVAIGLLLHFL